MTTRFNINIRLCFVMLSLSKYDKRNVNKVPSVPRGKLNSHDISRNRQSTYTKAVLKQLATQFSPEFAKGFDERNLNNMKASHIAFPI